MNNTYTKKLKITTEINNPQREGKFNIIKHVNYT